MSILKIKDGNGNFVAVPTLQGPRGATGAKGDKGDNYTLTAADKQEIAGMALPTLPSTDGSYILTVTISNGEPTYTWQLQN